MEDYVDGHASKITFSAKLYLDGYMHYHFAVDYTKDEILYLTFSTSWNKDGSLNSQTTVSFTRSQVVKLLKEILTGIDENSEIGKRLSKNDLNNINMVKKLLVDTGIIDKQDITIGKIDNTLKGIVPTVFKVLDFIKDATIRPNVDNRTIHIEKDYDYVSKKTGEVTTYSTNIDLKEDKTSSTNTDYIFDIKKLLINNKITINGIIKVKKYEGTIYVNKSKAISLNGMENLAVAFFNSVEEMNFNITGTAGMGIGKLELAGIDVDCRVAYVNGIIRGYIHLKVPAVLAVTKTPLTASAINSYIYIDDKDIYMYKDVKYTDWFKTKHDYSYRKNTYKGFMKNIADNMIFLLNFTDTIANQITNSGDEIKLVPDKFLTSYSYKNDSYNMVLDLKNGLSNNMFSDLSMSIKTGNYNSKSYLRSFSGSTKLFSILSMTFDFKENGCFGSKPNMNVINTYFDNLSKFSYYKE